MMRSPGVGAGCPRGAKDPELSARLGPNRAASRPYPGLERILLARSVRAELLLAQVQAAIEHQKSPRRPWQRYEPPSAFLDGGLWPTDEVVLRDLTFAKLAIELLSEQQRAELDLAVGR